MSGAMVMSRFELVVKVVTACSTGDGPHRVSAEVDMYGWTIRISSQSVVYKGATLDDACQSLLDNWQGNIRTRAGELRTMLGWLEVAL